MCRRMLPLLLAALLSLAAGCPSTAQDSPPDAPSVQYDSGPDCDLDDLIEGDEDCNGPAPTRSARQAKTARPIRTFVQNTSK